jgi:hypothetical protein
VRETGPSLNLSPDLAPQLTMWPFGLGSVSPASSTCPEDWSAPASPPATLTPIPYPPGFSKWALSYLRWPWVPRQGGGWQRWGSRVGPAH